MTEEQRKRLKNVIKDSGIKRKELALMSGVSSDTLVKWLRGSHSPTLDRIENIVKAINDSYKENGKKTRINLTDIIG